jgi:F-type H+-transporting ATPase subunit b
MRSDSRLTTIVTRTLTALLLMLALGVTTRAARSGQEAPAAAPQHEAAHAEAAEGEHAHESGWFPTIAKMFNFAVLVGVLVYFLREPLTVYLNSRITKVREDLVTAATTRENANRLLAEIQAKVSALPAELSALKQRGAEEIAAERARIEEAAETERVRLLDQTRREIEMHTRILKRQLLEFAATQAVAVATRRITQTITPADQARLVDRYAAQLKETGL